MTETKELHFCFHTWSVFSHALSIKKVNLVRHYVWRQIGTGWTQLSVNRRREVGRYREKGANEKEPGRKKGQEERKIIEREVEGKKGERENEREQGRGEEHGKGRRGEEGREGD